MKEGSLKSYSIGFGLSIVLTAGAFWLVETYVNSGRADMSQFVLIASIIALAVAQLVVQLVFFLHLGSKKPVHLAIFISTIVSVLIIVIGSIWIMNHLNYNMTPDQINQYMQSQQGF